MQGGRARLNQDDTPHMSCAERITPRQRMLAAYRGQKLDRVPVAPEFWYYLPARLLGVDMIEFNEIPHWEALRKTFAYYDCEGWGIVAPVCTASHDFDVRSETRRLDEGRFEQRFILPLPDRTLTWSTILDVNEPPWAAERMVKNLDTDWPIYEAMTLGLNPDWNWQPVRHALTTVGEAYLLEVFIGMMFLDYVAGNRDGGIAQAVLDVIDREKFFIGIRERYIDRMCRIIREAFRETLATSVFLCSGFSCPSLVGPPLFRKWEYPVIEAAARTAHECGGLLHVHLHGRVMEMTADLPNLGADCICPFERPPGGDVTDLHALRRALGDRVTMNGNVHTVETLIRGTPQDVHREVLEILEAFAGSARLVVGTGDQVGRETPEENLFAMIDAVKTFGRF